MSTFVLFRAGNLITEATDRILHPPFGLFSDFTLSLQTSSPQTSDTLDIQGQVVKKRKKKKKRRKIVHFVTMCNVHTEYTSISQQTHLFWDAFEAKFEIPIPIPNPSPLP